MNKTYKWKVPKSFYKGKCSEAQFLTWISDFSEDLCSVISGGLRKKTGFSYDNYDTSRDDFDYAISFDEEEAFFVVNFTYEKVEIETLIFDVFISAQRLKKFLLFYRRSEPEREVFDKFHDAVIEIAKENNIEVFEE